MSTPGAPSSLYLDVLILNNSDKSLRTLTLLVEQLDANDQLLASQRVAAEVTALTPGISQTVGVELGPAHSSVEGIRLILELDPGPEIWDQFPEFNRCPATQMKTAGKRSVRSPGETFDLGDRSPRWSSRDRR